MRIAIGLALYAAAATVTAQEKAPLKIVIPYAAGGTTDYLGRLLQKPLAEVLGQSVIAENRPGAAGTIGTEYVARAAPDGNTIVFGNQGPNAIVPAVRKTGYDPITDLRPLTTVALMPLVLVVPTDRGAQTLKAYLEDARKPGRSLNYGSSGVGSLAHLTAHDFARLAKIDATHIPYQGGGPTVAAMMRGDVQFTFATSLESASIVSGGRLRILAVAGPKRSPTLPEIPAIAEELPGFDSVIWFAMFAPRGMKDADAERLRTAIVKAIENPSFSKYLADRHAEARGCTPAELTEMIRTDMKRWGGLVNALKIPI